MFRWFRKPRNLMWVGDVLIDARTDEVLARVVKVAGDNFWGWSFWDGYWTSRGDCAFLTRDGAKKFVEEKFR